MLEVLSVNDKQKILLKFIKFYRPIKDFELIIQAIKRVNIKMNFFITDLCKLFLFICID